VRSSPEATRCDAAESSVMHGSVPSLRSKSGAMLQQVAAASAVTAATAMMGTNEVTRKGSNEQMVPGISGFPLLELWHN